MISDWISSLRALIHSDIYQSMGNDFANLHIKASYFWSSEPLNNLCVRKLERIGRKIIWQARTIIHPLLLHLRSVQVLVSVHHWRRCSFLCPWHSAEPQSFQNDWRQIQCLLWRWKILALERQLLYPLVLRQSRELSATMDRRLRASQVLQPAGNK